MEVGNSLAASGDALGRGRGLSRVFGVRIGRDCEGGVIGRAES